MKISIYWFRRDLRLEDNIALNRALLSGFPVLPLFIFDTNIIDELKRDDPGISFIYETLNSINRELSKSQSSVLILKGDPMYIWQNLIGSYDIESVYINKEYEPYAIQRDDKIGKLFGTNHINFHRYKDQVIFEENEVMKPDSNPYSVFTPYRKSWLKKFQVQGTTSHILKKDRLSAYFNISCALPSLDDLGFRKSNLTVKPYDLSVIENYDQYRDIPFADRTSYLGPHLRFGTVSIRSIVSIASEKNAVFLNELIWREFFIQILFHFPHVITANFKKKYDDIRWRNSSDEFEKWCRGETGYPIVDAGMRQLNETGYMHNRIRMITAGFLCKHLLIDWRWGEAWFAGKLLDYELSSNNGNWQWAAGTGCDAAPYFRIFNPVTQQKRYDPRNEYIRRWVPDYGNPGYPGVLVEHYFARKRAITVYKDAVK